MLKRLSWGICLCLLFTASTLWAKPDAKNSAIITFDPGIEAVVYIDGKKAGKTPLVDRPFGLGTYQVEIRPSDKSFRTRHIKLEVIKQSKKERTQTRIENAITNSGADRTHISTTLGSHSRVGPTSIPLESLSKSATSSAGSRFQIPRSPAEKKKMEKLRKSGPTKLKNIPIQALPKMAKLSELDEMFMRICVGQFRYYAKNKKFLSLEPTSMISTGPEPIEFIPAGNWKKMTLIKPTASNRFRYWAEAYGEGKKARLEIWAEGDLDGDSNRSLWLKKASVNKAGFGICADEVAALNPFE